jgi:hypothetical protein
MVNLAQICMNPAQNFNFYISDLIPYIVIKQIRRADSIIL